MNTASDCGAKAYRQGIDVLTVGADLISIIRDDLNNRVRIADDPAAVADTLYPEIQEASEATFAAVTKKSHNTLHVALEAQAVLCDLTYEDARERSLRPGEPRRTSVIMMMADQHAAHARCASAVLTAMERRASRADAKEAAPKPKTKRRAAKIAA